MVVEINEQSIIVDGFTFSQVNGSVALDIYTKVFGYMVKGFI